MSNVWFVSDLHLGHTKIAEHRGFSSVKEHDDSIIDTLALACHKKHVLWILGDIAFGKHNIERLKEVPAIIKIVLGNHDTYDTQLYLDVANRVYGAFAFRNQILLTHIPVETYQSNRFKLNVHGHTHKRNLEDDWYFNVCVEHGYPTNVDEVMSHIND